nr:hypothetical protein [Tanacetum cinerariifolium]
MTIRSILLAEKLTGLNFINSYRNLRIVPKYEKKMKFVEQPIVPAHDPETANLDTIDKYYESITHEQEDTCLMLLNMYSKKAETPTVLAIREGRIQKDKNKLQGAKGKSKGKNKLAYAPNPKILPPSKIDNPAKDSICHHYRERDRFRQPTHDESHEKCKSCISGKMAQKPFPHEVERAKDLLGLIHTNTVACILNMVPTKMVDREPDEMWHKKAPKLSYLKAKFFENTFMVQKASRSHGLLEISRSDKGLELI